MCDRFNKSKNTDSAVFLPSMDKFELTKHGDQFAQIEILEWKCKENRLQTRLSGYHVPKITPSCIIVTSIRVISHEKYFKIDLDPMEEKSAEKFDTMDLTSQPTTRNINIKIGRFSKI